MRETKDSGIVWLGKIPKDWELTRFKYVVDSLRKGSGITKEEVFDDGDTPCIRYGEIYSKYDNYVNACKSRTNEKTISVHSYANSGDLLFAGTGELVEEIGKNILYAGDTPCLVGGDIIIASHHQNPYFLNYVMNCFSSQEQKSYGKVKLKVVHISAREIGNVWISLPPIPVQKRIAEYLNSACASIDDIIVKQKRIIYSSS